MIKFKDTIRHITLKFYLGMTFSLAVLGVYIINVDFIVTEQAQIVGVYEKNGVHTVVVVRPNNGLKKQVVTQANAEWLRSRVGKTIDNTTLSSWASCMFIVLAAVLCLFMIPLITAYIVNRK